MQSWFCLLSMTVIVFVSRLMSSTWLLLVYNKCPLVIELDGARDLELTYIPTWLRMEYVL